MRFARRRDPAPPVDDAPSEQSEPTVSGQPLRPGGAVAAMLDEAEPFEDRPWIGASYGEMLPPSEASPPVRSDGGLVIEPPPWKSGEAPELAPLEDPPPEVPAIAALKLARGETFEPPPLPGPPEVLPPLVRPLPPEPDWRADERERAAAEAHARLLRELEEEDTAYPKGKT